MKTIIVIGGGAAGIMAAGAAAEHGANVILIEKNDALGKKLLLTGGGRCNITNTADVTDIVDSKVLRNPSFLYSALYGFDSTVLRKFLDDIGVPTKVEDAGRVFPVSENALDVLKAFVRHLDSVGVEVIAGMSVLGIRQREASRFLVMLENGTELSVDAVIIATGGLTAPHTGSEGDGYRIARPLGHDVSKIYPALVPLVVQSPDVSELMGISLQDVGLVAKFGDKAVYKDFGDVIFTHFGISGPVALRASAHLAMNLHQMHEFFLDFASQLSEKELGTDILRILAENPNRDMKNCLLELFPMRLIVALLAASGIDDDAKAHEITKESRKTLCVNIKAFRLEITGNVGFGVAVITCGGVNCDEIDPGTMQSKLVPGLYFAGEVLDVDALTGGYNLQIAFSTGRLAGLSAALAN